MASDLNPILDWVSVPALLAVGAVAYLFLSLMLRPGASPRIARLIAILLALVGVGVFHDWMLHSRLALQVPHILGLGPMHYYLIGPLVLALVWAVRHPQQPWRAHYWLHLLPALAFQVPRLPIYLRDGQVKAERLQRYYQAGFESAGAPAANWLSSFYSLPSWHAVIYLLIAIWMLRDQPVDEGQASRRRRRPLRLVLALVAAWLMLRGPVLALLLPQLPAEQIVPMRSVTLALLVIWMVAVALRPKLTLPKLALPDAAQARTLNAATKELVGEQRYRQADLSLAALAEYVGCSAHELSASINAHTGGNFNQWVNDLRTDEALRLLSSGDYRRRTLEKVGYDVGFNSKSSFYRAFKARCGVSPSEWLKQNQQS